MGSVLKGVLNEAVECTEWEAIMDSWPVIWRSSSGLALVIYGNNLEVSHLIKHYVCRNNIENISIGNGTTDIVTNC